MCVCVFVCRVHALYLQVLLQQLPLQPPARLPLLSQLSLGVAVLRVLPARLLLRLVQLALQGADPLGHLEDQSQSGGWFGHIRDGTYGVPIFDMGIFPCIYLYLPTYGHIHISLVLDCSVAAVIPNYHLSFFMYCLQTK